MKRYKKYIFGAAPFRNPIISSGKGNYFTDVDGNKYLDLMSGQFATVFGHANPAFNKVVIRQLSKITHTSTLHLSMEVLETMKTIASVTAKGLNQVLLLSTGSEAVECAIRNAKFYTKKNGVVGIDAGYHGLTLAAQSISSGGRYAQPRVHKTYSIPTPDWQHRPKNQSVQSYINDCLKQTRKLLDPHKGLIGAFVIEPIISVGGMIYPPKQYFIGLKRIIKQHDALLIFDECQTGFGRTGTWFGYEHTGVVPDILVLAKNAGLGLPVSIVVFSDHITKKVESSLIHFSSHQNDPIAAVVVKLLINTIKKKKMLRTINKNGSYFIQQLIRLSKTEPWIENPRGKGLMIGFDMPFKLFTRSFNPGKELMLLLEQHGVNIQATRQGKTFRILPAYTITKKDINFFITTLKKCFSILKESQSNI